MENITQVVPNIHRLVIPYKDIYTTVFIVKTPSGSVLFDTASDEQDTNEYIFSALKELGITAPMLKYVVISHNHGDHAGGLERLMEVYPQTIIVSRNTALREKYQGYTVLAPEDGTVILNVLRIITVPGHTEDAVSLLDQRSQTLLTGDSLQLFGIYGSGAWGANIRMPLMHLAALDKLRKLPVETIVASHDYHPCGYMASGKEVARYMDECAKALYQIRDMIRANQQLSDVEVAQKYNSTFKLPTVGAHVFAAIREAMDAGKM